MFLSDFSAQAGLRTTNLMVRRGGNDRQKFAVFLFRVTRMALIGEPLEIYEQGSDTEQRGENRKAITVH